MSSVVLPSLVGLGFEVVRTPVWDTIIQTALSGKETRIAKRNYPRWRWDLTYNVLRSGAAYNELQQLAGFFNARQGQFDSFLYQDADDNAVASQVIAEGDGVTQNFQLVRTFGGFIEPVLAPKAISNIYVNGVVLTGYSLNGWGTISPGTITLSVAPAIGTVITADFSYYFPCRMNEDSIEFSMFISQHYKTKKFSFISVKN